MRRALPLLAAIAVAGCATPTRVHTVGPNRYLLCDVTRAGGDNCDGANPEKGIAKVCLPDGRAIVSIRPAHVESGVIVTCGGTVR